MTPNNCPFLIRFFSGLMLLCTVSLAASAPAQTIPQAQVDWSAMTVSAKGFGVPPKKCLSSAQAQAMAERAAVLDARRQLLEALKGVRLDSETTVVDFIAREDKTAAGIEGVVQLSQVIEIKKNFDGTVEALVAAPLAAVLGQSAAPPASYTPPTSSDPNAVRGKIASKPALEQFPTQDRALAAQAPTRVSGPAQTPADPTTTPPQSSGIVLDARGLGFVPAIKPELYTPKEQLYPPKDFPAAVAQNQGYVRYFRDPKLAAESEFAGNSPTKIKAKALAPGKTSALVIDEQDAKKLAGPNSPLAKGRLVIVF